MGAGDKQTLKAILQSGGRWYTGDADFWRQKPSCVSPDNYNLLSSSPNNWVVMEGSQAGVYEQGDQGP